MPPVVSPSRLLALLLAATLGLLSAGCAPTAFLTRRMTDAPNRAPEFVKPSPRLMLRWPAELIDRFPGGIEVVGSPPAPLRWVIVPPADYGLSLTSRVETAGRAREGWISMRLELPGEGLPPARPARGTAFLLHGYGVDLETLFPWAVHLAEHGWQSVLVDLRGHGGSGGRRFTFGLQETNDIVQLHRALRAQGLAPGPTVAIGHSLGAAFALRWAVIDPEVTAAVAFGAPARFVPSVERVRDEYARWVPRSWVTKAAQRLPRHLGVEDRALDTEAAVEGHHFPAFLIAGFEDRVTPPEDSARLRQALGGQATFLIIDGVSHETLPYWFEQHGRPVTDWLDALVPPGSAPPVARPAGGD